jgi:hypothetical protein
MGIDLTLSSLLNLFISSYGLPLTGKPPNGLNPLLEIWGKGKNRFPLLVLMNHPFTWVVTLPSNDVNGEDGTIQAGEYSKGDTATFFVYQEVGHVDVSTSIPCRRGSDANPANIA